VVVPAVIVLRQLALRVDRPAELAAPDHQRLVQQPALLQIAQQAEAGLVDVAALQRHVAAAGRRGGPSRVNLRASSTCCPGACRHVRVRRLPRGWDHHGALPRDMPLQCRDIDQACFGLLSDLKQRGCWTRRW